MSHCKLPQIFNIKGISRLRARPKGAALWKPATFEKAAKAFDTGLVCDCLGFVPAPGVFCFFFAMILKFDFCVLALCQGYIFKKG